MLARVRISVPDRPGSLGSVTSLIGSAGGDIAKVDVLESESGRALDDVFVLVRDLGHLQRVIESLNAVPGVTVVGTQQPVPPVTGHTELELVQQVLSHPERGLQTLVDGAPRALGADWAALVEFGMDGSQSSVLATSTRAPHKNTVLVTAPLRLTTLQLAAPGAAEPYTGAALVPLQGSPVGLVLVRESGVEFHRSELWRLGQIGAILGPVLTASV
jgi:hypothetical protein